MTDGVLLQQTLGYVAADGLTGAGVGVAIIDSGLRASADFGGRITAFYDFTLPQGGAVATAPTDPYGHGTHVAGLVGGNGSKSNGLYKGVAPGVSLIGLRVLGADGSGYTSDVIEAIEFATAHRVELGIDVLNLSLGHLPYESAATDPQVLAVNAATAAGLVVVVSSGNDGINPSTGLPGYAGILSPGNAASALTVGSSHTMGTDTRADDEIGPYSSRGPTWYEGLAKPDVVAPGHKMVAPYAPGSLLGVTNPTLLLDGTANPLAYLRLTGTSMSTAVVSGVVAHDDRGASHGVSDQHGSDDQCDQGDPPVHRRQHDRPADCARMTP